MFNYEEISKLNKFNYFYYSAWTGNLIVISPIKKHGSYNENLC